jgi:hypothetical protein
MATYRIPIKLTTTKGTRNKALIVYIQKYPDMTPLLPDPGSPEWDSLRLVEIEAKTHADAYRQLLATILPRDPRPIMGKWAIRYFKVQPQTSCPS